ncbi:MAG: DUF192 domain-containing protein [Steroidobacteraceae bacterium]
MRAADRWHGAGSVARFASRCAAVLLLACAARAPADVTRDDALPLDAFPREPLVVETRSARRVEFDAWRADTPETREQGLMFVTRLDPSRAMFFVYDPPARVSMWMKNTLIPLDMLFVDAGGCVVMVKRDALPQSLALISAPVAVSLVVELAGGTASRLGISAGDRVARPAMPWPDPARRCNPTG